MKQSDPLEFVEPGTLMRPGPLGRIVRLSLGVLCLYALWDLLRHSAVIIAQPFSSLDGLALLVIVALCVFNYVVNIGFGKEWGHRPLLSSLAMLGIAASIGYLATGRLDNPIFGVPLVLWLGYLYAHLGVAFVLAALIATPGCEMRSIPEVIGRVTGKPTEEHHCPAAFITKIDQWERRRLQRS